MLRFLVGKEAKKRIVDAMIDKAPGILSEKIYAKLPVKSLDYEKLEIEKQKLSLEQRKLEIEEKKLKLESDEKMKNSIEVAHINAKSRKHGAYWRSGTTIVVSGTVAYLTYNYFKPTEDELKKTKEALAEIKSENALLKKGFFSADIDAKMHKEVVNETKKYLPPESLEKVTIFEEQKKLDRIQQLNHYEFDEATNNISLHK